MLSWLRNSISAFANRPQARGGYGPYDQALWHLLGGYGATHSGIVISPANAMEVPAVYASVKLLSESVALLPMTLYRNDGSPADDHPLNYLLGRAANPETSAYSFREQLMTDLLLHGNAYAYKVLDDRGRVAELWGIPPEMVSADRENGSLAITYRVTGNDNQQYIYSKREVLHIRTLGTRGWIGESPIWRNREAIALALTLQQHTSRIFANGARPSGVLEYPGKLGPEIIEHLKKQFKENHSGQNSGGTMILEEGLKFNQSQFSSVDAQLLELRQHQFAEIARVFNIPPPLLQDLNRATHSNAEQMGVQFIRHTLKPWLRNIEQAVDLFLLDETEREGLYSEFRLDDFTQAETSARWQAYNTAIMNGLMSANEIRAIENLPPYAGGEDFRQPLNQGSAQTRRVEARLLALANHLASK